MAATSKYFVTLSPGFNLLDFDLAYGTLSLQGQEIVFTGTSGIDNVAVAPGIVFDFTKSNGGIDNIYLQGNLADYTATASTSTVTLTRGSGATAETIVLAKGTSTNYDNVSFSNGTAKTIDLHAWGSGGSQPTLGAVTTKPTTLEATIKAFALDSNGEVFASSAPGINFAVTGSNGVDTVYVKAGATVDATKLNGGEDKIYFTGDWADYTKTATSSKIVFTSTTTGETVTVAAATGASNDRLIFADGYVLSNNAKTALLTNANVAISAVTGYSTAEVTPLSGDTEPPAAPAVALTTDSGGSASDGITNVGTLHVTGTETGATVQYSTDGGTTWSSSFAAAEGANAVQVRQVDTAGNASAGTAINFTLDTIAPTAAASAPTTTAGQVIDETEAANGFAVVASLIGTNAVAGDTIELKLGGQSFATPLTHVLTSSDITANSYTFTVSGANLGADGTKSLTSVVTDVAGNAGATSAGLTLTLDASAPTVTSLARQNPSGASTNADTLVYRVAFSEAVSNVDASDFSVTGTTATVTSVTSVGNNAYDVTVSGGNLASLNGNVTLGFAGGQNISDTSAKALVPPSTTATYTVDNTAPSAASSAPTAAAGPLINASEYTAGVQVTASLAGTGAAAGDTIELKLGGQSFATPLIHVLTADDISAGTYTFTAAYGSLDGGGTKSLTSVVTDAAGNVGAASAALTLTLDATAPLAASSAPTAAAGPTINAAESTAGFTVVASLAGTTAVAGDTIELKLGGQSFSTPLTHVLSSSDITAGNYTFSVAANSLGSDGSKSLTSVVTDAAGNIGAASSALTLALDTAAPTLSSIARQTPSGATTNADTLVYRVSFGEAVSNVDTSDFAVTGTTATVISVVNAGSNSYDVTVSGGNLAALNGSVALGFANGQNITDAAGNALTTPTTTTSYTVDNTAPSAPSSAPTAVAGPLINAAESASGFSVVASLAGTNAVAGDVVELKLGGNSFTTPLTHTLTSADISSNSYTFTVAANSLGSDGTKSLTAVVTDAAGNAGSASAALSLTLDTVAPSAASSAPTTPAGSTIDAAEAASGFSVVASLAGTNAAVGNTVELKLGGVSFGTPLTHTLTSADIGAGSYTFTVTGTDLGSDGTKSLTSVVTDAAGNEGAASAALALTLNTTGTRSLSYSTTTFVEDIANDGSIHTHATLTLSGDTFAGNVSEALNGVTFSNVPSGLTGHLVKISDTVASLEFTGNAGNHADTNDIANLTVNFGNAAFTNGNASGVVGASRTDLSINFADPGLILNGNTDGNVLNGTSGKDIVYGNGGADVINGGAGNDTIDVTDIGTTSSASATIIVSSAANGLDTVIGFKGGALSGGGDVLDLSGIASLTDSVETGMTLAGDFHANNVFVFTGTQVSISDAAAAIAADTSVTATTGYIVIADSNNHGTVTVYHSTDLAANGVETALVVLSGVSISSLTSANLIV